MASHEKDGSLDPGPDDYTRCQNCGAVILTSTVECGRCLTRQVHVSVRYLLVELPLIGDADGGDPDEEFYRIQGDLSEFLWEDPALAETPTVTLVYPGDVVPGGESDG